MCRTWMTALRSDQSLGATNSLNRPITCPHHFFKNSTKKAWAQVLACHTQCQCSLKHSASARSLPTQQESHRAKNAMSAPLRP